MTDFYGVSGRAAAPENALMTEAQCERKIALLRVSWSTFRARVGADSRPRGRTADLEPDR
ncbi:MAG TPA: hypothetical protein VNF47_03410 [Streptosporangiaceae bacterium]|nr:hypothetical protein [Streptosporangiaceae bacterium]